MFADRFTTVQDFSWFEKELRTIATRELGAQVGPMLDPSPVFVDFMRDAPEPVYLVHFKMSN